MDKVEHAVRLRSAMAAKGYDRTVIADATDRKVRTVTNWTSGHTLPSEAERHVLRRLLGDYDTEGDPVDLALRASPLTEDRMYDVLGYYKRRLREQQESVGQEA